MGTNFPEKSNKIQPLWEIVKPLLIVAVLSGAFFLLYKQLKNYHYHDLANQLKTYSRWTIALALAITTCNYFILTFVVREALALRKNIEKGAKQTIRAVAPFIPTALSLLVFFSGALLMFSVATPSVKQRLLLPDPFIPLELLVVADALRRRVDLAYYLTLLLLGVGAVFSLLKGLDWEEALILSMLPVIGADLSVLIRKGKPLSPAKDTIARRA